MEDAFPVAVAPEPAEPEPVPSEPIEAPVVVASAGTDRWRQPLAVATAAVLVAGITFAIARSPSRGPVGYIPPGARLVQGRVVSELQNGALFLSAPDGGHRTSIRTRPFAPADQALLVDTDESVVAVRGSSFANTYAFRDESVAASLTSASAVTQLNPLTDQGRAVVVLIGHVGLPFRESVGVETISGDHVVRLGSGDSAAGDPESDGAFVSVGAPRAANDVVPGGIDAVPDVRLELRDIGQPPLPLATAPQLNADVHDTPNQWVNLGIFPDRDGQKIAVVLNPVGGTETNSPVVIIDRRGRVLDVVPAGVGPMEYTSVYWSPDGTSLAYATISSLGTALAVLRHDEVATQNLEPGTSVAGCTWSPDSAWVLCLAASAPTQNWLLASNDAMLSPIYSLPARGAPVAWLP